MREYGLENVYKSDLPNAVAIDHEYHMDARTAQISLNYLVETLAYLYEHKPFKKLTFLNHYGQATETELFDMVIKKYEETNTY